ncbi:uncharacterized protein LOC113503059 [Trichoplusia ni]|uniref:Uncharacterized protein LOC113503059 n=1 Tax=Trichoplusia ni TaxID=7111 RepID=A0A7E5WKL4_TRINI|nr:uncharacterized protein LOC113503059 [Trichoplusia ni]
MNKKSQEKNKVFIEINTHFKNVTFVKNKMSKLIISWQLITFIFFLLVRENSGQNFEYQNISIDNNTSCEEFVTNYTFNPETVVDIDWTIFYFWNHNFEETYTIKFSIPTKTLIDRFRVELDDKMKPPVNWSNAELFMETSIDFSGLFIRTNVSGIFIIIPSLAFEYEDTPQLLFSLKYVQPNYLGILNCKYRLCYALAPVDRMPDHHLLEQEAKKLGFHSNFGRTHTAIIPPPPKLMPPPDDRLLDDDDEDEHLELINSENLQLF